MWKYNPLHLTKPISESRFKRMGEEGWELATCVTQYHATPSSHHPGITKYIYYFKMPREGAVYGGPR